MNAPSTSSYREPNLNTASTSTFCKSNSSSKFTAATKNCFNCGAKYKSVQIHRQKCAARSKQCFKCGKTGHFSTVCQSAKNMKVSHVEVDSTLLLDDLDEQDHHKTFFVGEILEEFICQETEWNQIL